MTVEWFEFGADCRNGALWDGEKCQKPFQAALQLESIINNNMQYQSTTLYWRK